ncbi:MAG: TetR/AcrR family transcriptional regulator [Chloroflexi bacterium]|jgi:AcrR family transcriptional regulator|nr:TetR/AcrR family transcriptional regulator [Chloroflexota bacterium]
MTGTNKGNPVSDRSKRELETALLDLMRTETYAEITIQEIAYRAGLSRRTFYRNFTSKEEILEGCFDRIWDGYRKRIITEPDLSLPNITRVFFTHMQTHRDILLTVNRHNLLPLFQARVDVLLPVTFHEARGEVASLPAETLRYALAFSAGGFMRILILWLNDGCRKSPDEMAAIVKDFLSVEMLT